MEVQKGDRVMVNVAPFIGSVLRGNELIPCEVIDADELRALVRTEPPYREVTLWVLSSWIEEHPRRKQELLASLDA
ncbi:MAG: hypothetical protein GX594_01365 [Pirellulaceae bacterium]|nr:hypothetical protein [Pirellulaceae bacterium]